MSHYLAAAWRTLGTEWRHTYRSACREHTRRTAARKFARELWRGLLDLPAYAREIKAARR
jgi:hypothetical protein